ncbi:MAG: hypothetical protein FWC80_04040 [Firmicutes bacterium]|nr:hypothetical protein [Bacillota bacterium]
MKKVDKDNYYSGGRCLPLRKPRNKQRVCHHNVIARRYDEAIPCKVFCSWDCFVAKASRNDNPVL